MAWISEFFYSVYENLEESLAIGSRWVGEQANVCYDAVRGGVGKVGETVTGSVAWMYEALQGDWNDDRTPAQIAADSVLAMVPIIDQILDIRDLCANCKKLRTDLSDNQAWLSLCFCLIGLFPSLGSLVKGVLKIIFVYVRRASKGSVAKVVDLAIDNVKLFLNNEKIIKILGTYDLSRCYTMVADSTRQIITQLNSRYLAALFKNALDNFSSLINVLQRVLPDHCVAVLREKYGDMVIIQSKLGEHLDKCLGPAKEILEETAARLEAHAAAASGKSTTNVPTRSGAAAQSNAKNVVTEGDSALKLEDMPGKTLISKKALFGEVVSDQYMIAAGHEPMLPINRNPVNNLELKAQGAYCLDGVYKNAHPPKDYIITEAKYRKSGEFSAGNLPTTKGSTRFEKQDTAEGSRKVSARYPAAKQMSDDWIKPRLEDGVGCDVAISMSDNYERWVLVVDDSGKVVKTIKLDEFGNAIQDGVIKWNQ